MITSPETKMAQRGMLAAPLETGYLASLPGRRDNPASVPRVPNPSEDRVMLGVSSIEGAKPQNWQVVFNSRSDHQSLRQPARAAFKQSPNRWVRERFLPCSDEPRAARIQMHQFRNHTCRVRKEGFAQDRPTMSELLEALYILIDNLRNRPEAAQTTPLKVICQERRRAVTAPESFGANHVLFTGRRRERGNGHLNTLSRHRAAPYMASVLII